MKLKIKILFALISIVTIGQSQNLFLIGNKSYKSTEKIKFDDDGDDKYLEVSIAKDGENGLLILSCESTTGVLIKGTVYVYLDDGTVITCSDKGIRDYASMTATSVYKLTKSELDKIKLSNINSLRYSLKCLNCVGSTEEGTHSTTNPFKYDMKANKVRADFSKMVTELLE